MAYPLYQEILKQHNTICNSQMCESCPFKNKVNIGACNGYLNYYDIVANIPKRQIQILTSEQLAQLFKVLKKKYPYLLPIVENLIILKQPLNTVLTGDEQQKKSLRQKIRKDFYKIKQELGLTNYMFDDLRFSNIIDN